MVTPTSSAACFDLLATLIKFYYKGIECFVSFFNLFFIFMY